MSRVQYMVVPVISYITIEFRGEKHTTVTTKKYTAKKPQAFYRSPTVSLIQNSLLVLEKEKKRHLTMCYYSLEPATTEHLNFQVSRCLYENVKYSCFLYKSSG